MKGLTAVIDCMMAAMATGCSCSDIGVRGDADADAGIDSDTSVIDTPIPDTPIWDSSVDDFLDADTGTIDTSPTDATIIDSWSTDALDAPDGSLPRCGELEADLIVPSGIPTIQAAIEVASGGDLVCVEPGVYHEHLVIDVDGIHLLGVAGPQFTVVDADFWGTVMTIDRVGSTTVIQGFTLRHGYGEFGGGIKMNDASPRIKQVIVLDNLNFGFGGGMSIGGGSPFFENVIVAGNVTESGFGGGMELAGDSSATFSNVVFAWNETWSGFGGGAYINGEGTSATMTNVIFAGNLDDSGFGGGIALDSGSTISLVNCTLYGNETRSGSGGGIHVGWGTNYIDMTNVDLTMNSTDSGPAGGGIHIDEGTPRLSHCNAWGNVPDNYGGIADPTGSNGNISADPLYLDTTGTFPLQWDLHIGASSSLRDAGEPTLLDPDGGRSDIGAFGGPGAASWDLDADGYPAWWQPGPYDHASYPSQGLDCDDSNPLVHPGAGC